MALASSEELAAWLRANADKKGTPDYQTVLRGFQEAVIKEGAVKPAAPTAKPESGFFPAFKAGKEQLMGGLAALAGRTGLMDVEAAQKEYEARQQKAKEIFAPTEAGWTESPVTKTLELLGGSLPYVAAPLVAGAGAATLPVTGTAATVLGLGAAGLASTAQFTATNLSRQLEEGKGKVKIADTDLGAAALAAVPQAALDTISLRMIPGIGRIFGRAGVELTEETAKKVVDQGLKKVAADYALATGKTMGVEGLTEAAQQVFERAQAGLNITDEAARKEYFDSFLGGAVLGGTLAPAGRYLERGSEQRKAKQVLQDVENKRAAEAQAAEEANKKDPEYALKLDADYQAAVAKMRELQAAVPKKPGKDALPEEWMAYKEAKEARDTHLNEVLKPLTTEWRTRQAEIAQLKERRRVEGMTPEEYMLEQMGVKPAAALTEPATLEEAALDAADLSKTQTAPEASAVEKYVADRIELANQQTFGTATANDYVDYLMQDPGMAAQVAASKIALPGLDRKTNAAVLSALKLQLEKSASTRLAQEQADLAAQQQVAEKDPLALWKASLEQAEDQATEELLRADVENINAAQPPIVDVPEGVAPMPDPRRMLARIDELIAARDQAVRDAENAFATGNQELGTKKAAERETAQSRLNNLSQTEGMPRVIIDLRKAQDTALLNTAQLTDDLKSGRVLGGSQAGTASSTPATLINQINKQREAFIRAAIQEAATIRRLFGRNLTQEEATAAAKRMQAVFDEWVTRSMAEPRSAVEFIKSYERDPKLAQADWLATAADAFVKDRVRMALAEKMRGPRLASIERGAPEERALTTALTPEEIRAVEQKALREFSAAVEKTQPRQPTYQMRGTKTVASDEGKARFVDPRPLEERQFGAFKAATEVLQEQLQKIVSRLTEVPQRGQRVEPVLKTQFASTEAGKVAEERGETAQTLEGALRRRRDYVDNLIDQALQTRNVPGIARMLLERAQDFLQQGRGTTAFLDAAENLASRLVLGQNIERSDLVDLRNELRAESARPGEAEVVGEREGQRELFGTEERRKDLGVIRETRARFENAPIVKRARAAAEKAKKLLEDLRVAFDAADAAAEKAKASKIKKAETDVEARREDLREAFQTALKKAQIAEVTAKFQPQIDALIQQLSVFGKERAKALREKETVYAKDLNVIIQTEREALQDLRQQLADALRAPSAFVEPATLPKGATRVVRGLTQPAELAAAGDEWVQFERDRLAKAEAKLRNLKGPERITVAKEVQQQRVTLNEAENIVNRARTGLGLPGLRVERQAIRAEIEALEARIPNIKDSKKQKKAQNRLDNLYKMLGESAKTIEGEVALTHIEVLRKKLRETTRDTTLSKKERNQKLAELNRQLAAAESIRGSKLQPVQERAQISSAEAAKRAEEKVATQEELENRALAVADEIEDLRGARARARTEASKQQIQDQIDERNKELTLLKGQLETPTLTRTEARQARKPQKTVFTGKGAEAGAETVATLQERLTDGVKAAVKRLRAANITVLEEGKRLAGPPIAGVLTRAEVRQQVLETEFTAAERKVLLGKTTQTPKQRAKLRELGEVVLRREREPSEQEETVEAVKEANVEDVMSFFGIGGKDVYFSRGDTANPSTTDSVRAELKEQFPDIGRVQIYDSVDALIKANPQYEGKIPSDARGFVDPAGNKAFLIAENIDQGQALSVLLHEVGVHIGMRETLGKQYNASINAVENWAKKDDGSLESRIAKAAQARVEKADTPASQQRDELIAYAAEEAVNAGVKPTETKSPIGRWLGQILSMFRNALRKFGLASKDLTAQELVDMAYGAAKLELRGQAASEAKATKDFIVSRTTAFIKGAKGEEPFASAGLKQITEDDTAYDTVGDATFITGMEVRERNKGFGKKLLENLTLWADENNKRLALLPAAQFDKQLGGLTQEQLKEWYARNGFKPVDDYMVREPKTGKLLFTYAGEKSGVSSDALRKAKDMQIKGAAPEKIWNETGWFQGPDKKWRYEIDDSKADFSNIDAEFRKGVAAGNKEVSTLLGNIMKHAELYKAYPELANLQVTIYEDANSSLYGSFNDKEITLNLANPDPEGTLIHEIQHYIQDKEGFGRGGNTTGEYLRAFNKKVMESVRASFVRQMEEAETASEKEYYGERVRAMDAGIAAVMQNRSERIPALWAAKKEYQEAAKAVEQARNAVKDFAENARKTAKAEYDALINKRSALSAKAAALRKQNPKSKEAAKIDFQVEEMFADARAILDRMYDVDITEVKQVLARAQKNLAEMHKKWLDLRYDTKDELKDVATKAMADTLGPNSLFARFAKLSISEYAYQNLLGEIEARDVSERRTMGETERQATRPYSSQPQRQEEILFSRKTDYAPGMASAGKVADMVVAKQPSTIDKIRKNLFGLEFRTQVIDALAPLEKIANTSMDALKGTQMMYYLRMYGMRNNMTAQAISNGVPQLKEITRADGRKEWIFESVKGANIKQIVERLSQKDVVQQAGSPDAANRLFTLYMAAIRGENVGYDKLNFGRDAAEKELVQIKRELASPRLSAQDKASLLARQSHLEKNIPSMPTEADFKSAKAEIENNPTLKNAFNEARGMYNEYNTNLLNFLVQVGAMSKEEAARLLRAKDYIPYYRMRGGNAELVIGGETPIRIGNLKDSPHLQELVGGEEPIFNFLDSSVQNTSMLLDMGMRNIATKNVAFELGQVGLASKPIKTPVAGAPTGTLEFKKDGVDYYVTVNTDYIGVPSDLLVKGMAGIPTMLPQGLRLMGVPSQILRRAVTSTPVFAVRQLFRESLGAFMLSGSDATPLLSSINQLRKDSPLEARGVTGGQVFTGTTEDMSRLLREMQSGRPGWSKAFAKMEAFALKTDAATRQAQFESYRNQGLSEMEASFMALESMNFSKRGLSATMHMASMLVPFLNAQIQGLDVLYKGLTGNMPLNEKLDIQRKVFTRGAMMFMATMAYAAAMQDDEEYKNAPPDQKYGNWFVRLPFLDEIAGEKVTLRVPVPFEIGYVFKSLPEMLYNSLQSKKDAEDAFKALNHILIQMVPGGSSMVPIELGGVKVPVPVPIPAAMKPVIEVGLGKSFFTGRDIESAREQQEVPGMRYRQQTSELAKLIGEAVNFSPIKIESLINGYTGGLGLLAMQALSVPLPKASVVVPESRWSELPLVGTMFQPSDAGNIIDGVYKDFEKVKQAKTTYDRLIEKGETGKAQAFLQENLQLITLNQFAGNYTQRMRELTKNESIIRGSNLTAEEKRTLLDQIKQAKIQIATAVRGVLEKRGLQASPA